MKVIEGNVEKVFALINTTKSNDKGNYSVQVAKLSELSAVISDADELNKLDNVDIDTIVTTDDAGTYIMRIA